MNPQPAPYVGNIFAFIFVMIVVYYTIKNMHSPSFKLQDHFVIGYLEDSPITHSIVKTTIRKTAKVKTKHSFEDQQLYHDCTDALVALGMKKKQAKEKTKSIFLSSNPPSVQEFLQLALKIPS